LIASSSTPAGNGLITQAEFEADPHKYRERALRNAPFTAFDRDRDSTFTVDEMQLATKLFPDACGQ
jgi:hypothetical protein